MPRSFRRAAKTRCSPSLPSRSVLGPSGGRRQEAVTTNGGKYVQGGDSDGWRPRADSERRLRKLLEALWAGSRQPDRGGGGDRGRPDSHGQCLCSFRPVLGVEGRRRRKLRRHHQGHTASPRTTRIFRRRQLHDQSAIRRGLSVLIREFVTFYPRASLQRPLGRTGQPHARQLTRGQHGVARPVDRAGEKRLAAVPGPCLISRVCARRATDYRQRAGAAPLGPAMVE